MVELSKDGYFLKPHGEAVEFTSKAEAESFKEWLQMGKTSGEWLETAVVDMFHDLREDKWIVTQFMRILTKISGNESVFEQYTESIQRITEANKTA